MSSRFKCLQLFLGCISLYLLDIIKGIEHPLSFQPPFSPRSSCLLKRSYNTVKVGRLHHCGTAISSCGVRPRPRRHWALSYKNIWMECLIHKAFEAFLQCTAMGDSGSENCLLRIFFLSFFLLLCLQQEQPQQLYGNFDMEIFRRVMTMKLLRSSEIRILGVFSQTWFPSYFHALMHTVSL